MKKKIIIGLSIITIIIIIIILTTFKKESEVVPEYVLTYAENHPEDYPTTLGGYKFAELVEERTEGRIKIIVRAGAVMGDEKDVVEQLRFGGIDFTRASLSSLGDLIPELNVLQMPFLYEDSRHMWRVLDGKIGDYFIDTFTESNLVAMAWYDAGARNFYTRDKAITCLEDMQGMKIRVQEAQLMMDLIEALGATPVPTTYREVYSELEIGNIDGAENNWPSYESSDHYEVATYYTIDEHTRVPEIQLCSQILWNKLSQKDREIISECAKESALYERKLWVEREKKSEEIVTASGVRITTLKSGEKKKFQEAVKGLYEIYCADYMDMIEAIINF